MQANIVLDKESVVCVLNAYHRVAQRTDLQRLAGLEVRKVIETEEDLRIKCALGIVMANICAKPERLTSFHKRHCIQVLNRILRAAKREQCRSRRCAETISGIAAPKRAALEDWEVTAAT